MCTDAFSLHEPLFGTWLVKYTAMGPPLRKAGCSSLQKTQSTAEHWPFLSSSWGWGGRSSLQLPITEWGSDFIYLAREKIQIQNSRCDFSWIPIAFTPSQSNCFKKPIISQRPCLLLTWTVLAALSGGHGHRELCFPSGTVLNHFALCTPLPSATPDRKKSGPYTCVSPFSYGELTYHGSWVTLQGSHPEKRCPFSPRL